MIVAEIGGLQHAVLDQDFAVHHRHGDITAAHRMHEIVLQVEIRPVAEQRRHARRVGAHGDDIGALAGFDRADFVIEADGACAPVIVAMRSTCQLSIAAASRSFSLPSSEATFISSNMSKLLFSFSPSVPMPTGTASGQHRTDAGDAAGELHVADRIMRHRNAAARDQVDFAGVEPDAMGDHRARRLEEAEVVEREHRPLAVAPGEFGDLDFRLAAMGVKAGVMFLAPVRWRGAARPASA